MRRPQPLGPRSGAGSTAVRPGPVAAVLLVAIMSAGARKDAAAQIPEEFHNLQVLPEDIDQRQLVGTMRGFAMGLGVRCGVVRLR